MLMQILVHTPLWVWGIFAVLLVLGYSRSKPSVVSKKRLAILPAVFIALSVFGIWSAFGANAIGVAGWLAGVALGLLVNRVLQLPKGVRYDAASKTFAVPGSFVPMVLMMAIFATKYVVAVTMAINHGAAESALFIVGVSMAYGFFSGSFLARSLRILRTERANSAEPAFDASQPLVN